MTAIVIIVYNLDARIFLLQIEAIKKFCQDSYVIEVFDNSTNEELSEAIKYHASNQAVKYSRTIPCENDPSHSHAFAANMAYKDVKDNYSHILFLDHDCIPVKPFSVVETLGNKLIAGVLQGQAVTKYFWPGCLMINNKIIDTGLVNFNLITKLRTDTGGSLHKIIDRYGYDACIQFDEIGVQNPYFQDEFYYFYLMINNKTFIHFINAANWRGVERNEERLNTLINITENLIHDSV